MGTAYNNNSTSYLSVSQNLIVRELNQQYSYLSVSNESVLSLGVVRNCAACNVTYGEGCTTCNSSACTEWTHGFPMDCAVTYGAGCTACNATACTTRDCTQAAMALNCSSTEYVAGCSAASAGACAACDSTYGAECTACNSTACTSWRCAGGTPYWSAF